MSEQGREKGTRKQLNTDELVVLIPWLKESRELVSSLTLEVLSARVETELQIGCTEANLENLCRSLKYHWKGDPKVVLSLSALEVRVSELEKRYTLSEGE